jgi:excisionase family DNA binding protein
MQQAAEHARHDQQVESTTSWLTIAEAAAALGVSVDTVRRRLKRRELQAEQVETERGPVWRVAVESVPSVPSTPGSNGHSTPSTPGMPSSNGHSVPGTPGSSTAEHAMHAEQQQRPELLKVLELLERAQTEVVAKAEAAAMWQARAELLAVQLGQAQDRLRALEAPDAAQDENLSEEDQNADQEPSAPRRPWWAALAFWRA